MFKILKRAAVLFAAQIMLISAAHARVYSDNGLIIDDVSGLTFDYFETIEEGQAAAFSLATDQQLSALFSAYIAIEDGGPLPDYRPTYGRISGTIEADGSEYSFVWGSTGFPGGGTPDSLLNMGWNIGYGDGLIIPVTNALLTHVKSSSSDELVTVLLQRSEHNSQDGSIGGSEFGTLSPTPGNYGPDWEFYCGIWPCPWEGLNPYVHETDGSLAAKGYIMVQNIPEPSQALLFAAGIATITLRFRRRVLRRH